MPGSEYCRKHHLEKFLSRHSDRGGRSDADLATKADLKAEIAVVKSDIKLLKWMVGVILACVAFPILKSFLL